MPTDVSETSELVSILHAALPLLAVGLGIVLAIVSGILRSRQRARLADLLHAERMASIQKGIEPLPFPPELLDARTARREWSPEKALRRGVLLLFTGLALTIVLLVTSRHPQRAVWGLVPMAAGAAYLLLYRLDVRRGVDIDRALNHTANDPHA